MCKKNNGIGFGVAVNTGKGGIDPGDQGVANIKAFIEGKFGTKPDDMTKNQKKAFAEMVAEIYISEEITYDEYVKIVDILGQKPVKKEKLDKKK
jgi:hypothetical protein